MILPTHPMRDLQSYRNRQMPIFDPLLAALRSRIESDLLSVFCGTSTTATATDGALTLEKLKTAMSELSGLQPPPRTEIVYSVYALETTTERLFPASKNRSKRIHKKLVRRFGGEFRQRPAMWRLGDTIYVHPSFRSQLEAQFKETNDARRSPIRPYRL
jgi:hypothetical protein